MTVNEVRSAGIQGAAEDVYKRQGNVRLGNDRARRIHHPSLECASCPLGKKDRRRGEHAQQDLSLIHILTPFVSAFAAL